MTGPFKAFMDIRRGEWAFSLSMFAYFFLVITNFWILKPLKKAAFVGFYRDLDGLDIFGLSFQAAQVELLAKGANMLVAAVAVVVFSALSRRLARQQLTFVFSAFFMGCYVLFALFFGGTGHIGVWSFYLFGDLFSTLMVATFFVFLNDSVTADSAKRLYGVVGLGGVLGGAFGSILVDRLVDSGGVSTAAWMWICFAVTGLIVGLALFASRRIPSAGGASVPDTAPEEPAAPPEDAASGGNPAFEGAKLVFRSPYLFSIVAIVGLYEITSNLIDFQFTSTVLHYVEGDAIGGVFSRAYMYMNIVAVIVQLFLTSFVMKRFGLTVALMVLPVAILAISVSYLVLPVLAIGILMPSADGGFAYSLNQSAKEALYVPTTRDEKYKAKAFIDMFVQRFGKVLAIIVNLVITSVFTEFSTIRWLSFGAIVVVTVWLVAVRYAGRRFNELTGEGVPR